ncbi:MAG: uncharacterized protein JWO85_2173 [Candidatus Eremiobacteraeota bacterium]|nr:uncharacterized protein [Candidatus Eremiobacteraeota bacterium]
MLLLVAGTAALGPVAAHADPLSVFQPSAVRAISVTPAEMKALRGLPPLDAFGTVHGTRTPAVEDVASASDAGAGTGFALRLPANIDPALRKSVRYQVTTLLRTSFTFSAAKAAAWAGDHKVALQPIPAGLDGTTYMATIEPLALVTYGVSSIGPRNGRGMPRGSFVAVMQARAPSVSSTGATVETLARWFSLQPGIPPQLAAQVRAIGDPTQTLPIPVRFDKQTAADVTVDGVRGLAIGDETGIGSAIVWMKDGKMYAVGGTLTQSGALALANDLQ